MLEEYHRSRDHQLYDIVDSGDFSEVWEKARLKADGTPMPHSHLAKLLGIGPHEAGRIRKGLRPELGAQIALLSMVAGVWSGEAMEAVMERDLASRPGVRKHSRWVLNRIMYSPRKRFYIHVSSTDRMWLRLDYTSQNASLSLGDNVSYLSEAGNLVTSVGCREFLRRFFSDPPEGVYGKIMGKIRMDRKPSWSKSACRVDRHSPVTGGFRIKTIPLEYVHDLRKWLQPRSPYSVTSSKNNPENCWNTLKLLEPQRGAQARARRFENRGDVNGRSAAEPPLGRKVQRLERKLVGRKPSRSTGPLREEGEDIVCAAGKPGGRAKALGQRSELVN